MVSALANRIGNGFVIPRGEQVIGRDQRRIRPGDLVAMHRIRQPQDGRHVGDEALRFGWGRLARIVETLHGRADFRQPLDVRFRPDDGVDEFATLPSLAIFEDLDAVRFRGGEGVHVLHDVGVARHAVAEIVAQNFLGRGHGGVVGGTRPHFKLGLRTQQKRRSEQQRGYSHKQKG